MAVLRSTDRLVRSPEAVLRDDFEDAAVLFHPHTAEALALSAVGVAIWKALDGRRTLGQVAAKVAAECDAPPEAVLEDTIAFAAHLHRRLFVTPLPEPEPL